MTLGNHPDPWEHLRAMAAIPDDRVRSRNAAFLTPDARRRLLEAAADTLGSIRVLVSVAEAVVRERIEDGSADAEATEFDADPDVDHEAAASRRADHGQRFEPSSERLRRIVVRSAEIEEDAS